MKTQLLVLLMGFIFSGLLMGCVDTNGWGYPTDCCFYQRAQCGSPCHPHGYKRKCVSSCERPRDTCCDDTYKYNCCDTRDYWSE